MIAQCSRRLRLTLAPVVLLAGCIGHSSQETTVRPERAASKSAAPQHARINAALSAAADYLVAAQSADGAWRSEVYSTFKQGDALTPLVILALMDLPNSARYKTAIEKGTRYLANLIGDDTGGSTKTQLTYPVYTAAGAVMVLARSKDSDFRLALAAWLKVLREQQLTEDRCWQPGDPNYGGWSYAKDLPIKPIAGQPLNPLAESNLSATVFALEALCAAEVDSNNPAVNKTLKFVCRCQNYSEDASNRDPRYDDGGFFFIQNDPVRNKAGQVGTDSGGRIRFASYGSTTADGLRALLLCGLSTSDARVQAARHWLEKNLSIANHPGQYRSDRESARNALYFYYCRSLAAALNACGEAAALPSEQNWRNELLKELLKRQRPNGSWQNEAVDVRENDPLVATSLAVIALTATRHDNR